MAKIFIIALIFGLTFAGISIGFIHFNLHFSGWLKQVFEISMILLSILLPQLVITKTLDIRFSVWNLAFGGWLSFFIYAATVASYMLVLRSGSFSDAYAGFLLVLGIAFLVSMVVATLLNRKPAANKL